MYLKSIEIYGFKSFANKIKLDFHQGITGIVGPNGSGKSNIADAVRWVLGEQSAKQLRGSSMQDVIFAGTENRKPLSYAYVAITLDNADHVLPVDYDEVTVARRVYRSGESEYLMNGTPCRLRNVHELFYDTGIGKEGYSIIGQGQIEQILSGKPEDRRALFDEAVGIVKYKQRKKEAIKKLADGQDNLDRVNDILSELERQVGPLEKQSETAKRYLSDREQLKKLDVNMFLMEVDRLTKQIDELSKSYDTAASEMETSKAEAESKKQEYADMQEALDALDTEMEEIRSQISSNDLNKSRLENQISILEEQIHSAESSDASLTERKQKLEADRENYLTEQKQRQEEKNSLESDLTAARQKVQEANAQYDAVRAAEQKISDQTEAIRQERIAILNQKADMKARKQKYATTLEQVQIRRSQLNRQIISRQSEEGNLEGQQQEAQKAYDEALSNKNKLESERTSLMEQTHDWNIKKKEISQKLAAETQEYHRSSSRLESLKNIAERYDGYGISIRKVMERASSEKGILGVVSDLIHVDKKYETAVETVLGGSIQNIVTEDEDTARRMIRYLKENRFGRATFLPLTSVHGSGYLKDRSILNQPGVLGRASDLTQSDDKFRDVVEYLLGRAVVVDNMDHAIAIARRYHYSTRLVTLDGEDLRPGGSISGGRYRSSSNLLGRKREIDQLTEEANVHKSAMEKAQSRLQEIDTAIALLEDDRAENQQKLSQAQVSVSTLRLKLDQVNEASETSRKAYNSLSEETAAIDQQIAEVKESQAALKEESQSYKDREAELDSQSEALKDQQTDSAARLQTALDAVSAAKVEEEAVSQKAAFCEENLARIAVELEKNASDIKNLESQSTDSKGEAEEKRKNIEEIRLTISKADEIQENLKQQLAEKNSSKEEMNQKFKGSVEAREELSGRISNLDKEIYRLEQQKEKAQADIDAQNSYMWDEYELTLHAAMEMKDETLNDRSAMRKQIAVLKDDIKSMGNVNVNAIEQYKEVSDRYTFMKSQSDDLVKAQESLQSVIDDLDEGMRSQFKSGFADIQREFNAAFKELFGGGKGTIELTDDEDVLEAGIRINAQPPGKKLQNMMQMSGGEKALTAIALLFAIQNLKPSPFCLLDEIEAALDDSNVDRYAQYLHKLTAHTQFIVITHRRGTMNAADRLYGVTMQEKGVSTLVSVNLIKDELDD